MCCKCSQDEEERQLVKLSLLLLECWGPRNGCDTEKGTDKIGLFKGGDQSGRWCLV